MKYLYCDDFGDYKDCCTSCHDDYAMLELDFPNDLFGIICCGISQKMRRITSHPKFNFNL